MARSLLRFVTAGSVDDGKSTLIGRMLHDAGALPLDHLAALRKLAGGPNAAPDFSLVTDGLRAEREQGITIDVAYRYFETARRRFIIADAPGHEQYTRNMATGASTADLAVLLVDARLGVQTQTRRHAFIASLLGVPRVVIAINKMDLVDFSQERFEAVRAQYEQFAARLGFVERRFIPVSAVSGDNVVTPSARMPWYDGPALLPYLEDVYVASDANLIDLRLPVQLVVRGGDVARAYAGTLASGIVRPGDELVVLPSGTRTRVKALLAPAGEVAEARAPQAVTLTLADEVDASRGDMLVHPRNLPRVARSLEAMVVWMSEAPLAPGATLLVKHTTRLVKASCSAIVYRVDPDTLRQSPAEALAANDIARVSFTLFQPLFVDEYRQNRTTGAVAFIDPATNATVGAGMVIVRERAAHTGDEPVSGNIRAEQGLVSAADRAALLGQTPRTVWLTGLPGSGKSTIAKALEARLAELGQACYVLDGDNLRHGLNRDLGFSPEDRRENIRRAAEVARLMNDAGLIVITAFISPYREDREAARRIVGAGRFVETWVDASLEVCEARDPKGHYRLARAGKLEDFTGIGAPYEAPVSADLVVPSGTQGLEDCVRLLVERLRR